jgi:hypothetical protein
MKFSKFYVWQGSFRQTQNRPSGIYRPTGSKSTTQWPISGLYETAQNSIKKVENFIEFSLQKSATQWLILTSPAYNS